MVNGKDINNLVWAYASDRLSQLMKKYYFYHFKDVATDKNLYDFYDDCHNTFKIVNDFWDTNPHHRDAPEKGMIGDERAFSCLYYIVYDDLRNRVFSHVPDND